MDIMDTARYNIKKHRELKGLRQQDMADKLNMNIRSYQSLENGETKLDLERLGQIADLLDTTTEDLLKPEGLIIHQEVRDNASNNNNGLFYQYGIEEKVLEKLFSAKNDEITTLKEEVKYLKDKIDQLLELVGKK
jgi:transcriptional regulator with XRE-family HTH domain